MRPVTTDDELRRQADRAHALVEVAQLLAEAVTDTSRLTALILDRVAHLVGDAVTIWLLHPGADHLDAAGTSHPDPEARRLLEEIQASVNYRSDDGITRPVIESGDPLVIAEFDLAARRAEIHPAYLPWVDRYGVSSLAVLPMRARGRVIGAVGTTRDAGRPPYTDNDIAFMQALTDCAAVAMDNAHLLREAQEAQASLRLQSELVDQVSDAIFLVDADVRIASWNAAAEAIYGWRADEVIGRPVHEVLRTEFFDSSGAELAREEFRERLRIDGSWRGEIRERHANGHWIPLLSSATVVPGADGSVFGCVAVNRDITELRRAEHNATHDPLTGLPNRRLLDDRLTHALARAARRRSSLAVLFVDLDAFKSVNDSYGHDEGDVLLRTCARRLQRSLRASDTVTRLGGDEFVVVAEDVASPGDAALVAQRILDSMMIPVPVRGGVITISASIGVVLSTGLDATNDLLRRADAAMYRAKQDGRGRWHLEADHADVALEVVVGSATP
jgi:diguanylate cyclase (GGDEF)-like protein/PAS domain S-box-containing protein